MESITRKYDGEYRLKFRNESLKDLVLLGIGFMTLFQKVVLESYVIYGIIIICLSLLGLKLYIQKNALVLKNNVYQFLSWYGVFVLYVFFTYIYSVNDINPDYVLKRISVIFLLALQVAMLVRDENDFEKITKGMIIAAVLIVVIVVFKEGVAVGASRIGKETIGSEVAFSSILSISFLFSTWHWMFLRRNKLIYVLTSLLFFVFIVLSGSRRALLLSLLYPFSFMLIHPNISKQKKTCFCLLSMGVIVMAMVLILGDNDLYNLIGVRLETAVISIFATNDFDVDWSLAERSVMRSYAFNLFLEKPLLGYGVHGFAYMFDSFYGKLLSSHNGFLEVLSCYGLVGFMLYYRVFIHILRKYRGLADNSSPCSRILFFYSLIILLCEFFAVSFISSEGIVVLTSTICLLNGGVIQRAM